MANNSHEWVKVSGNIATVGISSYAIEQIGEIINIKLPKKGKEVKKSEEICVIESTKSAIDIHSPLNGKIIDVNKELLSNISLINNDPENKGWLFKVEAKDINELEKF